jgi:HTH-like domain
MIAPGSELSIARQARLLGVSRSSVYYRPRPESQEELDLLKRLDEIFTANPMYGSRRLQAMLKREGTAGRNPGRPPPHPAPDEEARTLGNRAEARYQQAAS